MNSENLRNLRSKIADTDRGIFELLNKRARLSLQIGSAKKKGGGEIYDPFQEEKVYRNIAQNGPSILPENSLRAIFSEIISSSRALQAPLSVAYLGPEASFSHQAAIVHFGQSTAVAPKASIAEVFASVEQGENNWGIVPIENSAEGSVKATMDHLISTPLAIRAEVFLRIRLFLLSNAKEIKDIRKIYSHPQALAQSREWLRREFPQIELVDVESTAEAARRAHSDPAGAAIGSRLAASAYGLKIIAAGIEESPLNTTRFFVIGPKPVGQKEEGDGDNKTSILFGTTHTPGALQRALAPFADEGINLTRIESWPMKERLWEYLFFVDFAGHSEEKKTRRCLERVKNRTAFLKILGSYPQGNPDGAI